MIVKNVKFVTHKDGKRIVCLSKCQILSGRESGIGCEIYKVKILSHIDNADLQPKIGTIHSALSSQLTEPILQGEMY